MRKIFISLLLLLTACANWLPILPPASIKTGPPFSVRTHPDGRLYVGDQVSFEVFNPASSQPNAGSLRINLAGKTLAEANFDSFGMGGRSQATFYWVWDTNGLEPGDYTFSFVLLPGQTSWEQKISLGPASEVPSPEPDARWKSVGTNCCEIYYISGTDAEKDLEMLKTMVDTQAADVESRMKAKYTTKIPITFLPRTLGHGGFTSDGIYVSYLHQNYAGGSVEQITHHEMVHWLDNQLGGKFRPSILQEGLAVYMSDGHFKIEPILPRATALLDLNWYIPLRKLADAFYTSQHESGYSEAAALVNYLVVTYGRDHFNDFYRNFQAVPPGSSEPDSTALDAALKGYFAISLDQLEQNFIAFLRQQPADTIARNDIRLTVEYYDSVRRYQRELDSSAYFLTTWLPDVPTMRQRGIVADFLRHPNALPNRQIEAWLVSGDANLRSANYAVVETDIKAVNLLLDLKGYFEK